MTDIERYKAWCLNMEASGNHGSKSGPTASSDAATRRGICFWGTGRGWQLKRDWRAQWAIKFPHVELPPKPELPARKKPLSRKVLDGLMQEYKSYDPNVYRLEYWPENPAGWRLQIWSDDGTRWITTNIGADTHEAADTLRKRIEKWKSDHNVNGQEPQLGGQPEKSGQEPMIGGNPVP
jgi:hypothetical protein